MNNIWTSHGILARTVVGQLNLSMAFPQTLNTRFSLWCPYMYEYVSWMLNSCITISRLYQAFRCWFKFCQLFQILHYSLNHFANYHNWCIDAHFEFHLLFRFVNSNYKFSGRLLGILVFPYTRVYANVAYVYKGSCYGLRVVLWWYIDK